MRRATLLRVSRVSQSIAATKDFNWIPGSKCDESNWFQSPTLRFRRPDDGWLLFALTGPRLMVKGLSIGVSPLLIWLARTSILYGRGSHLPAVWSTQTAGHDAASSPHAIVRWGEAALSVFPFGVLPWFAIPRSFTGLA